MLRIGSVFLTFFVTCFFLSGAMAALVIVPLFGDGLGAMLRSADDGSTFPAMIAGFLMFSVAATAFILNSWQQVHWAQRGGMIGFGLLIVIIGQYAILPGWSVLPVLPTVGSGIVSGIPALIGAVAAAFVNDKMSANASVGQ